MKGEEAEPFTGDACVCFSFSDPTKPILLHHVQEKMNNILAQHFLIKNEEVWTNRKKRLNGVSLLKTTNIH